jgi:hypothetical protein
MVIWPIDPSESDEVKTAAVFKASKCAVHLIQDCRQVTGSSADAFADIKIHCGISCGLMHMMFVGEVERWEYLVSGPLIRAAGVAESEAEKEEVCLTPEAFELVKHLIFGAVKPNGSVRLTEFRLCKEMCEACMTLNVLFIRTPSVAASPTTPAGTRNRLPSLPMMIGSTSPESSSSRMLTSPLVGSKLNASQVSPRGISHETMQGQHSELASPSPTEFNTIKHSPQRPGRSAASGGIGLAYSSGSDGCGGNDSSDSAGRSVDSPQTRPHRLPSIDRTEAVKPADIVTNEIARKILMDDEVDFSVLGSLSQNSSSKPKESIFPEITVQVDYSPSPTSWEHESAVLKEDMSQESFKLEEKRPKRLSGIRSMLKGITGSPKPQSSSSLSDDENHRRPRSKSETLSASEALSEQNLKRFSSSSSTSPALVPVANPSSPLSVSGKSAFHQALDKSDKEVAAYLKDFESTKGLKLLSTRSSTSDAADTSSSDQSPTLTTLGLVYKLFVPGTVISAVNTDTVEFLSEIRMVSTLFIEVLELDDDFNKGSVSRPQRALVAILRSLRRHEGCLRQFVVDDKGVVAIAGFGIPDYCHDDNCVRAVEAAMTIRRRLQALKLNCKIGVTYGRVYCGLIGSAYRCEFAMMGSCVNLAARLMSKCKVGQILVDSDTHDATCDKIQYVNLQRVKAKGYKSLISVFSPLGYVTSLPILPDRLGGDVIDCFVGRQTQLKELVSAIERFHSNSHDADSADSSEAHVIEGLPGIGKTWLLCEVRQETVHFNDLAMVYCSAPLRNSFAIAKYEVIRQILEQILLNSAAIRKTESSDSGPVEEATANSRRYYDETFIRSHSRSVPGSRSHSASAQSYSRPTSPPAGSDQDVLLFEYSSGTPVSQRSAQSSYSCDEDMHAAAERAVATVHLAPEPKKQDRRRDVESEMESILAWVRANSTEDDIFSVTKEVDQDSKEEITTVHYGDIAISPRMSPRDHMDSLECSPFISAAATPLDLSPSMAGADLDLMASLLQATRNAAKDLPGVATPLAGPERVLRTASMMAISRQMSVANLEDSLAKFLDDSDSDGAAQTPRQLTKVEAQFKVTDLLPLLNSVLGTKFKTETALSSIDRSMRERLLEALILFIITKAVESTPTVVIVEKAHLCDVPSLNILAHIVRFIKRKLFFLCTIDPVSNVLVPSKRRPTIAQTRVDVNSDLDYDPLQRLLEMCDKHELFPFDLDAVRDYMAQALGHRIIGADKSLLSDDNMEIVMERTGGLPFLVCALALRVKEEISTSRFVDFESVSFNQVNYFVANFDGLSRNHQLILKLASVLGRYFSSRDLSYLVAAMGIRSVNIDVTSALEFLVGKGLLELTDETAAVWGSECATHRFYSSSVHESIYSLMVENQRQAAHHCISCMLEDKIATEGSSMELLKTLAGHYSKSRNIPKRLMCLLKIAEEAVATRSFKDCDFYFRELVLCVCGKPVDSLVQLCTMPIAPASQERTYVGTLKRRNAGINIFNHHKWLRYAELKSNLVWLGGLDSYQEQVANWIGDISVMLFR